MSKIRKGDQVVVLSGRDKGRQGQVLKVLASGHVLVENVNKQKKHQKPNQQANQPGGIIEKEMPLPAKFAAQSVPMTACASVTVGRWPPRP